MKVLKSEIDSSVNFIFDCDDGYFEARFVQRQPDYFICYLSSHSGCNRGCKMCHLTETNQTMMEPASFNKLMEQAYKVLEHYEELTFNEHPKAKVVHFNFMARGEALLNDNVNYELLYELGDLARGMSLASKFNISTIMPLTLEDDLARRFSPVYPTIYYSLYSLNEDFRRKWLPSAMNPNEALLMLKEYQGITKKTVKLHYALIKGENDNPADAVWIAEQVKMLDLQVELNLVRYNSPDSNSEESDFYDEYLMAWDSMGLKGKIIPRVGMDVMASCGTFIS